MIWIDRKTGTWGDVYDLVIVDADAAGQHIRPDGDEETLIMALDVSSGSEIISVAEHALELGCADTADNLIRPN